MAFVKIHNEDISNTIELQSIVFICLLRTMPNTSIGALRDDKYEGSTGTSLNEMVLAEIGRIVANYGLLVTRIREFVTYVASQSNRYPCSISTKDAIHLFPSVLDVVKPAFSADERYKLRRALENVATAKEFIDRSLYCSWGVISRNEDGTQQVARAEYRQYGELGSRIDRREFSNEDLSTFGIQILKTMNYVGDVYVMLEQKISDEPNCVRKILNRKMQRH